MKFHFWHTTLSLFFAAVAVAAFLWLDASGKLFFNLRRVPPFDFFLMALATARLVRLFTYDNITAFIREWFLGWHPKTFLGSLGTLINCPWCTGLWFALLVAFFYFATPIAWYAILVLALSAAASTLQLLANLIGWHAEAKKLGVQSRAQ